MNDWFSEMERRMLAEMMRMRQMMETDTELPILPDSLLADDWPEMLPEEPVVRSYGYRMVKMPGREPVIEQWGDVPEGFGPMIGTGRTVPEQAGRQADEKDPMLDINETDSEVMVTMELPGFKKDGIELYLNGNSLVVKASSEEREAKKVIPLPAAVDEESIRATYRNGVLDVSMKKSTAGMKKIDIE